ncbi:cold shock domain-containing protein [Streptomyces sp. NPDC001205]
MGIRLLNDARGVGLLEPADGGDDITVHYSAIQVEEGFRSLSEGQEIEFDIADSQTGPTAVNVRAV